MKKILSIFMLLGGFFSITFAGMTLQQHVTDSTLRYVGDTINLTDIMSTDAPVHISSANVRGEGGRAGYGGLIGGTPANLRIYDGGYAGDFARLQFEFQQEGQAKLYFDVEFCYLNAAKTACVSNYQTHTESITFTNVKKKITDCTNGATNPPECTMCPSGKTMVNGKCEDTKCSNGATNYPDCTMCPAGKNMVNGKCVDPCANGATNPPECTMCPSGNTMVNGKCEDTKCSNGATNYPDCTMCPAGKNMVNGKCVDPCANGATNPPECTMCPAGQTMVNGKCEPLQCNRDESTVCAGDRIVKKYKVVENNQCVEKTEEVKDCTIQGETCSNGQCVKKDNPVCSNFTVSPTNGVKPGQVINYSCQGSNGTYEIYVNGNKVTTNPSGQFTPQTKGTYNFMCRVIKGSETSTCPQQITINVGEECANGATNPPECTMCPAGQTMVNGKCEGGTNPGTFPSCNGITVNPQNASVNSPVSISCNGSNATSYQLIVGGQTFNSQSATWTPTAKGSYDVFCKINGSIDYAVKYLNITSNNSCAYRDLGGSKCAVQGPSPVNNPAYGVPFEIQAPLQYCTSSAGTCVPAGNRSIPVKGDVCKNTINVGGGNTGGDGTITKSVSKNDVKPGEEFTFTITVRNTSQSTMTGRTVKDYYPDLEMRGWSSSSNVVQHQGGLNWKISVLYPGESVQIFVKGAFDDNIDYPSITTRTNTVELFDESGNSKGRADAYVRTREASSDLIVKKTFEGRAGNTVTYKIELYNGGEIKANNVKVVDYLPPYMSLVSASPSQSSYQNNSQTVSDVVTWNIGSLPAGDRRTITVVAKIDSECDMIYINSVSSTTTTREVTTSNNSSSASFKGNGGNTCGTPGEEIVGKSVDLLCEAIDPPSIQAGEYLPFRWLMEKNSSLEFVEKCENNSISAGKVYVIKNSAKCEFTLTDSNGGTRTTWRDCFLGNSDFMAKPLLASFKNRSMANVQKLIEKSGVAGKGGASYFEPTQWSSLTSPLGEYKISLSKVSYTRCGYQQQNNARGSYNLPYTTRNVQVTSNKRICEYNFAVTSPYRVDKNGAVASAPQAYIPVLQRFKFLSNGTLLSVLNQAIDGIKKTVDSKYKTSSNLEYALKSFVDKYKKLATQNANGAGKVPNKPIYIYNSDTSFDIATVPEGTHVVLGNATVRGTTNDLRKVLIVAVKNGNASNGNIIFDNGSLLDVQKVSGIFIANNKITNRVNLINNNPNGEWIVDGRLHVDGILISPDGNLDDLTKSRRSSIKDWFNSSTTKTSKIYDGFNSSTTKTSKIYDGGSLVISPRPEFWLNLPAGSNELVSELTVYRTK